MSKSFVKTVARDKQKCFQTSSWAYCELSAPRTVSRKRRGGGKRQATTPAGAKFKDHKVKQEQEHNSQPLFSSIALQGSTYDQPSDGPKRLLKRMFKTAPTDGNLRDNIIIEIPQVNRVPFKDSLHYKEAKFGVFKNCLEMDPTRIHGLSFAFSD